MPNFIMHPPFDNDDHCKSESILTTIRKMIGPSASYDVFDTDLIIHINAAFSRLCQLGVGPAMPFKITGNKETWSDFIKYDIPDEIKQYVYLKTKIVFDPPASATILNAYKDQINELEWTMKEVADIGY